jgi:hypothetical protein
LAVLAPHEMLDVTEAEFERDRPSAQAAQPLPAAQAAPVGDLSAAALPQELSDLSALLAQWAVAENGAADADGATVRAVHAALLADTDGVAARYAQVAYKAQLLPLLGDAQAQGLPGATGDLARQPWRLQWHNMLTAVDHPTISHLSGGQLEHFGATPSPSDIQP